MGTLHLAAALGLGLLLAVLSLRRVALTAAAVLLYRPAPRSTAPPEHFTVLCVCRNEKRNLERLLAGLDALNYPPELLRVVLVDDNSNDGTAQLLAAAAAGRAHWRAVIFDDAIQRGKAQAVHDALAALPPREEGLILSLDADHVLDPDALVKLLDYFADPAVGAVGIYHDVVNRDGSLVATYSYLESAVTEQVSARGQHALGLNSKLAGVWCSRLSLLRQFYPKGWRIVDDADFGHALTLAGWRTVFAADVRSTHFVPTNPGDYIRQHLRWSSGLYQGSKGHILRLARSEKRVPLGARLDGAVSSLGYVERPLLVAYFLLALAGVVTSGWPLVSLLPLVLPLAAALMQIAAALWLTGASARLVALSLPALSVGALDLYVSVWAFVRTARGAEVTWSRPG
jgi:cellulose synthase/poly-beta-1,6-N-acetylglucosamine synthase-like glycosyltransferase